MGWNDLRGTGTIIFAIIFKRDIRVRFCITTVSIKTHTSHREEVFYSPSLWWRPNRTAACGPFCSSCCWPAPWRVAAAARACSEPSLRPSGRWAASWQASDKTWSAEWRRPSDLRRPSGWHGHRRQRTYCEPRGQHMER